MNTSTFLTVCLETLSSFSREFSEEEVRQVVHSGKLPAVIERLWEFTGYFYKWPAALLTRFDLPSSAKEILSVNLKDELGGDGAAAHTVLFSNMARSLGVTLPVTPKHGTLIRQALSNAIFLDCPKALGQFFANEATPKWRGFMEALQDFPGVDLEFFRVHANEERHYLGLIESFSIEHLPTFWIGIIEYAKLRASFMDGLRNMLQQ